MDLQMTFLLITSKAEKNFLNLKLICVTTSSCIVKFQATNSIEIASIQSAYLNYYRYIFQGLFVNYDQWLTCVRSDNPPIDHCCPFKTAPHAAKTDVPFSKLSFSSRWIFPKLFIEEKLQIKVLVSQCEVYAICDRISEITR